MNTGVNMEENYNAIIIDGQGDGKDLADIFITARARVDAFEPNSLWKSLGEVNWKKCSAFNLPLDVPSTRDIALYRLEIVQIGYEGKTSLIYTEPSSEGLSFFFFFF